MKNYPRTHVELANMIYSCIDLSEHNGATLRQVIEAEKNSPLSLSVVEDWLRGLPSACTIPFCNAEVEAILESSGNLGWSVDDYWRFAAGRILSFAKNPEAYK